MNANNTVSMYEAVPVVSELNKVPGFDPLKYLRKTKSGWNLDLKIKKLWFRLKYPSGRIRMTSLKITDQLAIIEARVYFDKNDTQPVASFTAQRENKATPGGLYIEAAQHTAMDEALSAAGFGIQFIPATVSETAPVQNAGSAFRQETEQRQEKMSPAPEKDISAPAGETPDTVSGQPVKETAAAAMEEATPVAQTPKAVLAEQEVPAENQTAAVLETAEEVLSEKVQEEAAEIQDNGERPTAYTKDMPVDDICSMMTVEEAGNIIVPAGTCKGWTLSQVADRRPVSLKWYLTGYSGDDNILRAGARIMQSLVEEKRPADSPLWDRTFRKEGSLWGNRMISRLALWMWRNCCICGYAVQTQPASMRIALFAGTSAAK